MNAVSILTMDFECGIIRFADDDNPFGLITNWSVLHSWKCFLW